MLLLEWDNWWEALPVLDAEEQLAAYTVGVMADPGWKMERDKLLIGWRDLIAHARQKLNPSDDPDDLRSPKADTSPGSLRRRAIAVASWFRAEMSSGPKRGGVDWDAPKHDE